MPLDGMGLRLHWERLLFNGWRQSDVDYALNPGGRKFFLKSVLCSVPGGTPAMLPE